MGTERNAGEPEKVPDAAPPLARNSLPAETAEMARFLIGKTLVHQSSEGLTSGRIVETEAYVVDDASSHAFRGETRRNRSMFLDVGRAYVYRIYGAWFCLNVVSEGPRIGAAVLIRALEPLRGLDLMIKRRGTNKILDLARGPGRLSTAMGIDDRYDSVDLLEGRTLWLADAERSASSIASSRRIGITQNADKLLRFYERNNRFVSGPASLRL